jgi:hypothetical protein
VAEEGEAKGGDDGDDPGEENALPAGPLQVEETLHGELARVRPGHRRALTRGEDPHGPDVHGGEAVGATQEDPAFVEVRVDVLVVFGEDRSVHRRMVQAQVVHLFVGLVEEPVRENRHHEHVYHETDEQRDRRFDEEVQVGVSDLLRLGAVHVARLHQRRVQVQVVGHYHSTCKSILFRAGTRETDNLPTIPTACSRALESHPSHHGTNIPSITSNWLGFEVMYSNPKVTPITVIKIPKNNSNLRKPYLSKNRNVKVSTIVISTPPQSGILQDTKVRLCQIDCGIVRFA